MINTLTAIGKIWIPLETRGAVAAVSRTIIGVITIAIIFTCVTRQVLLGFFACFVPDRPIKQGGENSSVLQIFKIS